MYSTKQHWSTAVVRSGQKSSNTSVTVSSKILWSLFCEPKCCIASHIHDSNISKLNHCAQRVRARWCNFFLVPLLNILTLKNKLSLYTNLSRNTGMIFYRISKLILLQEKQNLEQKNQHKMRLHTLIVSGDQAEKYLIDTVFVLLSKN